MKNKDLPAYPLPNEAAPFEKHSAIDGLTKREHFAVMAMQGILSNSSMISTTDDGAIDWISVMSVKAADALLEELDK